MIPNKLAFLAFSTSALLIVCIYSCRYTSSVIYLLYGLYWKNLIWGFLIIVLSIWNLPSLMKMTLSVKTSWF